MGRVYDGKKRWNETVLRTNAASASTSASAQRNKKTKRFSGRTMKLSKAMQHVDEETRAIVRNARLDALEADNFGVDAETGDGADDASDDMYVDEDDANGGDAAAAAKDKKARKNRKPALKTKAKKWKVKSLAQLVFEEHGAGDDSDPTGLNGAPPTYISVAAGPSTHPPRRFCCVCGFFAVYSCTRCGSRYCRVKCGDHHKESGCLKFGL